MFTLSVTCEPCGVFSRVLELSVCCRKESPYVSYKKCVWTDYGDTIVTDIYRPHGLICAMASLQNLFLFVAFHRRHIVYNVQF